MKNDQSERISAGILQALENLVVVFDRYWLLFFMVLAGLLTWRLWTDALVSNHDADVHLIRVVGVLRSWQEGYFSCRWYFDVGFGQGYPLLNYYAPLFYYLSALFALLFHHPVAGMNTVLVLGFLFSGICMYFFARELFGKPAGLVAAVAYMFAPYHIWCAYHSGYFTMFLAASFLPFVWLSFLRAYQNPGYNRFLLATGSFAILLLMHILLSWVCIVLLGLFLAVMYFEGECRHHRGLIVAGLAIPAGLGLAAFFILPGLMEGGYVSISAVLKQQQFDYHYHFLTWKQVLWNAWTNGIHSEHSFMLGYAHVIVGGFTLVLFLFFYHQSRKIIWLVSLFGFCALGFVFIMSRESVGLWDSLSFAFRYFQGSWRFFYFLVFFVSLLTGAFVVMFSERWRPLAAIVLMAIFIILNIGHTTPSRAPITFEKGSINNYAEWLYERWPGDGMEYVPVWVKRILPFPPKEKFSILKGDGRIDVVNGRPRGGYGLRVLATRTCLISFNHWYFPGWKVFVDGKEEQIHYENDFGYIMFGLLPGNHDVLIRFDDTPPRTTGKIISLATVFLLFIGWGVLFFRSRQRIFSPDIP
ncbi:MAG: hypothetical protein HQL16_04170 [Candidatus Omnitrophica bacterium]|nr:hypothetical protein [Candidatus Omnitrophota bacterium]